MEGGFCETFDSFFDVTWSEMSQVGVFVFEIPGEIGSWEIDFSE